MSQPIKTVGIRYIKDGIKNIITPNEDNSVINEFKSIDGFKGNFNGNSHSIYGVYIDESLNEQNGLCAICGCKQEHNGKPLVFIIDHIDGNAANNKRNNLRCICPNCDSQLDTYKSKNKNGARSYYRYHKFDNNS